MAVDRRYGTYLSVLMLSAILLACAVSPPGAGKELDPGPRELPETVASLKPEGWELSDPVSEFTPETLYQQINGNAELYLAYDVVKLTFGTFADTSDPGRFIDMYIYDMGTPTNGFGIYSVERFEGEPPVNLGREAYRSDANHYVWQGQYYIQILASEPSEALREIGRNVAGKAADALSDTGDPVWGLSALPREDRIDGSIKFFLVDAMGLDFMKNTYTADYTKEDLRVRVFLSQRPSVASAVSAIRQYSKYAERYGSGAENVSLDGIEMVACDMGGRYDIVFHKGPLAAGVLSVKDRSLALRVATDLWKRLDQEESI